MPCNIGYKTYQPIRLPQPKPQTFRKKMPAPKVDQELMDKLGADDPEFLAWMNKLNTKPLLEEALKRTLESTPSEDVDFSITNDGNLLAEGMYQGG